MQFLLGWLMSNFIFVSTAEVV